MTSLPQELILKNSLVYDANNKIDGEKKDLLVRDGKIVDSLKNEQNAKVIDAKGCVTFPGFIDLRSHYFAQETIFNSILSHTYNIKLEYPKIRDIEQAALNHGFTFLCEMDVPIIQSKIALQNMHLSPFLDHAMIMDIGSNWSFITDFESEQAENNIGTIISLLLGLVKGYGVSTNCPYHQQFWKLQEISDNTKIPMLQLETGRIYDVLTKACHKNRIPVHFVSPYGKEDETINQMEVLKKLPQRHFTFSTVNQFFCNNRSEFIKFHASQENLTCDLTPFTLGTTCPLITRDRNFALQASKESKIPMATIDLEFDAEYYITGRVLRDKSPFLNTWVTFLRELQKNSDLRRVAISSNAPYHISMSEWPTHLYKLLSESQNEIGLLDLSAVLSANPAKILNLDARKGHLGTGADADFVCFSMNPEKIDQKSFVTTKIVVKNGIIIKQDSAFLTSPITPGRIYWSEGLFDPSLMKSVQAKMEKFYKRRFSLHLNALETSQTPLMEKI